MIKKMIYISLSIIFFVCLNKSYSETVSLVAIIDCNRGLAANIDIYFEGNEWISVDMNSAFIGNNKLYYFLNIKKFESRNKLYIPFISGRDYLFSMDNQKIGYVYKDEKKTNSFIYDLANDLLSIYSEDATAFLNKYYFSDRNISAWNLLRSYDINQTFEEVLNKSLYWNGYSVELDQRVQYDYFYGRFDEGKFYTVSLVKDGKKVDAFPHIFVVDFHTYATTENKKYLMLEAFYFEKDVLRFSDTSSYLGPLRPAPNDSISRNSLDSIRYGYFIYELLPDGSEISNTAKLVSIPPDFIEKEEDRIVKIVDFDSSHMNFSTDGSSIWGTPIEIAKGTLLYTQPKLANEYLLKEIDVYYPYDGKTDYGILLEKSEAEVIIQGKKGYWYRIEDSYGSQGWVFGNTGFKFRSSTLR